MWRFLTRAITIYIPDNFLSGDKQAFREKYTICFLILTISSLMIFFIELMPLMICSFDDLFSWKDIYEDFHNSLVVVRGNVFNVNSFIEKHPASSSLVLDKLGQDVSDLFPLPQQECISEFCHTKPINSTEFIKFVGTLVWSTNDLEKQKNMIWMRIEDKFYNTTSYILNNETWFKDDFIIYNRQNEDATYLAKDVKNTTLLLEKLYIGKLDTRFNLICTSTNISFLSFAGVVIVLTIFKFLCAISQLVPSILPSELICQNVIINIPCYSEDLKAISKTIESICSCEYRNDKKLMFIVCDGKIKGRGNSETTPSIILKYLGKEYNNENQEWYQYSATSENTTNSAQLYSGVYKNVPFIVIVKIGNTNYETGNRGKRDSQVILFDFLNYVSLHRLMENSSLNHGIYSHFVNLEKDPFNYDFLLTVDADTKIHPHSLLFMVNKMMIDPKIIGLSGETKIENKSESWITAIQVYEYFISQNLTKAFESLFRMVTCLPGCFSIYRIKNENGPILVCDEILDQYRVTSIKTLHQKNLLSLGEDRYMTTLLLKTFPEHSTKFIIDAICFTTVPNDFKTLLSQRRRWINSTIHNLVVLTKIDLCGFSIFSMRTVVFLDLISTLIMPITVAYFYYLMIMVLLRFLILPTTFMVMIVIIYLIQILIFTFKQEWLYFIWLFIYTLAHPIWNIIIPLYAFWNMDDFSWGETRKIESDSSTITIDEYSQIYKPKKIYKKKYKQEYMERDYLSK